MNDDAADDNDRVVANPRIQYTGMGPRGNLIAAPLYGGVPRNDPIMARLPAAPQHAAPESPHQQYTLQATVDLLSNASKLLTDNEPTLTALELRGCDMTSCAALARELASRLSGNDYVETLDLSASSIPYAVAESFLNVLAENTNPLLSRLVLADCRLPKVALELIATVISLSQYLKELCLKSMLLRGGEILLLNRFNFLFCCCFLCRCANRCEFNSNHFKFITIDTFIEDFGFATSAIDRFRSDLCNARVVWQRYDHNTRSFW
jgi:hypothetical protein